MIEPLAAFRGWLAAPPPRTRRDKPKDLLYGIDDRPPPATLVAVAGQHVLLALMLAVFAVLAGRGIGLDPARTAAFTGACLFCLGLGTAAYGIRSRLTPGLPLVNIPNPATLATYVAVVNLFGLEATVGAFLVANVVIFLLAGTLPRLRAWFPPEVIGVVVLMLGVSLLPYAARASVGMDARRTLLGDGRRHRRGHPRRHRLARGLGLPALPHHGGADRHRRGARRGVAAGRIDPGRRRPRRRPPPARAPASPASTSAGRASSSRQSCRCSSSR